MKKYLLIVIIPYLTLFLGCGRPTGNSSGYLSSNVRLFDPKNLTPEPADNSTNEVLNFIRSQKINKTDALKSVEALNHAFKSSYIGYNLKKKLINKSGDDVFTDCQASLNQNTQASSTLSTFEYYDLISKCLAGFKDSHLSLDKKTSGTFVVTAVAEAVLINNKLYISHVRPNLIKKFEEIAKLPAGSFANKLKLGSEITLINGQDPKLEIKKLMPHISASSDLAQIRKAVGVLFTRNMVYPKEQEITLSIKQGDSSVFEATLPWVQYMNKDNTSGSPESRVLLSDTGIFKSTELTAGPTAGQTTDSSDDKDLLEQDTEPDFTFSLFKDLKNRKEYEDSEADQVLITGIAEVENHNYCYLKLNTFDLKKAKDLGYKIFENVNTVKNPRSLIDVIKTHLSFCETFAAPLIFDLRNNPGGNVDLVPEIFELFNNSEATTPNLYGADTKLMQVGNSSFINVNLNDIDTKTLSLLSMFNFLSMKNAKDRKQEIGNWVVSKNTAYEKNIYSKKIVLLISSACGSACELMATRFKKSKRALILGEATSGTGFGFVSTGSANTEFRDPLNLFEVSIPNSAFQIAIIENDADFKSDATTKASLLELEKLPFMENSPVVPDIEIKYTVNDLLNRYPDYIRQITTQLRASE